MGDGAPSGGEAVPGGGAGTAVGCSGGENQGRVDALQETAAFFRFAGKWKWRRYVPATFLLVGQLLVSVAAAAAALLAAGGAAAEGALADKRGAAGVKRGRHAALLLPALLPLQTGGKGTAHRVAQPLSLMGGGDTGEVVLPTSVPELD